MQDECGSARCASAHPRMGSTSATSVTTSLTNWATMGRPKPGSLYISLEIARPQLPLQDKLLILSPALAANLLLTKRQSLPAPCRSSLNKMLQLRRQGATRSAEDDTIADIAQAGPSGLQQFQVSLSESDEEEASRESQGAERAVAVRRILSRRSRRTESSQVSKRPS